MKIKKKARAFIHQGILYDPFELINASLKQDFGTAEASIPDRMLGPF